MSKGQRYHLLKNHDKPSSSYIYPTHYLGGCNRAFKHSWFEESGWWLVYSQLLDGAFCVCCCHPIRIASMINNVEVGVTSTDPYLVKSSNPHFRGTTSVRIVVEVMLPLFARGQHRRMHPASFWSTTSRKRGSCMLLVALFSDILIGAQIYRPYFFTYTPS